MAKGRGVLRTELEGLNGAPVVVTAAGAGIGRGCCEALSDLGALVIGLERDEQALLEVKQAVEAAGGRFQGVCVDVLDGEALAAAARDIEASAGPVKGLVNVVGTTVRGTVEELSDEDWAKVINTDLTSVFVVARAFLPLLRAGAPSSMVNIASSFALVGEPQMPAYCAAKGGIVSLTRQMAVDYGPLGVRVNSVCPGPTRSPRLQRLFDLGLSDEAALVDQVLLSRLAMPREIGCAVAFLISDAASFVHGANLPVDGGQTAHTGSLHYHLST